MTTATKPMLERTVRWAVVRFDRHLDCMARPVEARIAPGTTMEDAFHGLPWYTKATSTYHMFCTMSYAVLVWVLCFARPALWNVVGLRPDNPS